MQFENDGNLFKPPGGMPRPGFLMVLLVVVGMGLGVMFDRFALLSYVPPGAVSNFQLISQAWNVINHHYVDRAALQPKTLAYGAISGMVDSLGDTGHSVFLPPGIASRLDSMESGALQGIGVEIQMKNKHVVIVAPMDNSPAQRAGLRSGDIIMSVNGKDIDGLPLDQVVERISGPVGTKVDLAILNPRTHALRNVSVTRAALKIQNVTWRKIPGTDIADIRIAAFTENVSTELRKVLDRVRQEHLQGVMLDLRDDPGGILDQAVAVASQFLTNGNVLLVKNAKGAVTPVPVQPGGTDPSLRMAVLINSGSASASEIVAGALHDDHRAELIGETTFGTGTVLSAFPLSDGSAILLAVQEWLTPNGQSFWHKGIAPDLKVAMPTNAEPVFPEMLRDMTPAEVRKTDDKQFIAALNWVQSNISGSSASLKTARAH